MPLDPTDLHNVVISGGLGLGLRPAALLLTAAMLVPLAAHYFTNINAMLLFWIAFILTRPWAMSWATS